MNCGARVGGPVFENWVNGASVFFEYGEYIGSSYQHEGQLEVIACPFCSQQQIDLTGQYGDLPLTEGEEDDQESE